MMISYPRMCAGMMMTCRTVCKECWEWSVWRVIVADVKVNWDCGLVLCIVRYCSLGPRVNEGMYFFFLHLAGMFMVR